MRLIQEDTPCGNAAAREQLLKRVKAGTVTVIDVRPAEKFAAGHIPGAPYRSTGSRRAWPSCPPMPRS
ncbi:rhodanese-like domain-containing protein [Streptomyces sp. NPDC005706]|uniref:rhodanese-like domain-containing protein n=1 Tax=Streptomyces sp. NPDC005706 TaxID=3157169 RepID=UPI0033DBEA28